ncbi:MAG: Ig-like domain-containing protein [Planctomycetota bacterium]|jgi:hypothetical protein
MKHFPISALIFLALATAAPAQQVALDYLCRYDCQAREPDHLMGVVGLSGDRALVGGNRGIALVDLKTLPVGGHQQYLFRLTGVNARDFYVLPGEKYVFVNEHRTSGLQAASTVIKIQGNTLQKIKSLTEPNVIYEKMCLAGNYLFVAAHSYGIRIFDVSNPENPTLVGSLAKGFVDAFAIAVDGNRAYVADGAGGLKIVDVTNKKAPALLSGETLNTAVGTAVDITVRNGKVYVACGGAGLAVYDGAKLNTRTVYAVRGSAESLAWVGSYLAVGSLTGVTVFSIGSGTAVTAVAKEEAHRRGTSARLRLAEGVAGATNDRLLVANWNYMDVYQVKPAASSTQPDIESDVQRIRFAPTGGTRKVTITNDGHADLVISSVSVSNAAFTTSYKGGTMKPGQSTAFDITYKGSASSQDTGTVLLNCNDPDENPLPIQVFGRTSYLDPGETAPDFTVSTLVRDPKTGKLKPGTFTLSQQRGKVVWFSIESMW